MKRLAIFICAMTSFLVGVNVSDGDSRTIQHRPSVPKSATVSTYYSQLKIALPSSGIALGQYEWVSGDIDTVETAAGLHVSHYDHDRGHWLDHGAGGHARCAGQFTHPLQARSYCAAWLDQNL